MLNNYHYFIVLTEELNISRAAKRLYISHQCLSKYLKNLEQAYRISFFERSPQMKLTPAGQAYLDMLRQIQFLENNLENHLKDIRNSKIGCIRLGTTEGRYRILIPNLLSRFKMLFPDVKLDVQCTTSNQLNDRLLKNELDLVLLNKSDINYSQMEIRPLLNEQLYVVISDHMLAQYFPEQYPTCKEEFLRGVDLAEFQDVPFIMSCRSSISREALETHMLTHDYSLNCVMELSQMDMHFMMSAKDYAASFCWSMYIATIQRMNREDPFTHLNIFPINNMEVKNQVILATAKGKILPSYGRELIRLIKQDCAAFLPLHLNNS